MHGNVWSEKCASEMCDIRQEHVGFGIIRVFCS